MTDISKSIRVEDSPPRVIPLLLHEMKGSSWSVRSLHLNALLCNLDRVFCARIVDDDVCDLFVHLCSLTHSALGDIDVASEDLRTDIAILALRVLLEMTNVRRAHFATVIRCIKRYCAKELDKSKKLEIGSKNEFSRAPSTLLESVSPIKSLNATNDGSLLPSSSSAASSTLFLDRVLQCNATRAAAIELLGGLDKSGIDVSLFHSRPESLHLYLPNRLSTSLKVFRDFVFCTPRPKLTREWGPVASVHIKTNIPAKSEVMYRVLVEGYNYGVNAPIFADVVGYTNRNWDKLSNMAAYGWPEDWDATASNEYAPGAHIGQYFSQDGFVVVRLQAKSLFSVGFSASAWLCFHNMGNGFPITATIHHQDADL